MYSFFSPHNLHPRHLSSDTLAVDLNARDYAGMTFNGDNVSKWTNRGNASEDADQNTAIEQPRYEPHSLNHQPAIHGYHDGSNLSNLGISNGSDDPELDYTSYTLYCVCLVEGAVGGGSDHIVGKYLATSGNREQQFLYATSGGTITHRISPDGNSTSDIGSTVLSTGTPVLLLGWFDGSKFYIRVGDNSIEDGNAASVSNGTSPFYLFSVGGSFGSNSQISEVLFYTTALDARKRHALRVMARNKWGV